MTKGLIWTIFVATVFGCSPKLTKVSGRNPDLFEKETDHLTGNNRAMGGDPEGAAPPSLYVKEKNVVIKANDRTNDSGSLFNPDDERNYLFTPKGPLNIGRFLTINVLANRQDDKKLAGDKEKAKAKAKEAKGKGQDELEDELLKALPDLAPAEKGKPTLIKSFKMQIAHRFDNGDVLAVLKRESQYGDKVKDIEVRARIPYDRLSSGEDLSTDDLLDVRFAENHSGERTDRRSSGWEDEYSLRLSGFDEVKSRQAQDIADQKQKLQEVQEKLTSRIKALGDERRQLAKQREEIAKKKAEGDDRNQNQAAKLAEPEGAAKDDGKKAASAQANGPGKPPSKDPSTESNSANAKDAAKADGGGTKNG